MLLSNSSHMKGGHGVMLVAGGGRSAGCTRGFLRWRKQHPTVPGSGPPAYLILPLWGGAGPHLQTAPNSGKQTKFPRESILRSQARGGNAKVDC